MKILHINTWDTGGAANAAKRLFRAQKKHGICANFLSLHDHSKNEADLYSYKTYLKEKYGNIIGELILLCNRTYNQIPTSFNKKYFFNRPQSIYRVENHPLVKEADIIHLHSTAKFINFPTFFKKIKKPIVWTLHDMNPFSGGKHYDSMMWKQLEYLEKKYIEIKRKSLEHCNLSIVGPSNWLKELSKKSIVFSKYPHYNIPYCIDSNLFSRTIVPDEKDSPRKLLFVAQSLNDPRKGFKYLLEALKYLDKDLQIVVMGNVASRNFFPKDINIKNLGFISSPEELSKAYSNVDLYIIPSIEDNLPNTIIESHMCGTPVVGFKKAGVANMIKDGFNGVLVDEIDGKGLANGIIRALDMINNKAFLHDEILNSSKSYYSEKKVVELYNDIYKSHYS